MMFFSFLKKEKNQKKKFAKNFVFRLENREAAVWNGNW